MLRMAWLSVLHLGSALWFIVCIGGNWFSVWPFDCILADTMLC